MNKYVEKIVEYAKRLVEEGINDDKACISLKATQGYMYATKLGVSLKDIKDTDVVKIELATAEGEYNLHASVYAAKEDVNAICHVHPKWVAPVAKAGATIPTVLDDMAQIVGPKCKTANNDVKSILAKLKGCNSCLIKDDGCITTGRSLDEAYTCVLVLDKAAHCFVSSAVIGKNVTINFFEAKLMQIIYKKKYSKANQENLQVSEEE
ncbi:MAG: class II aldolase/adducin family protein [Clostridiales bacterium]|nr:class II aldolase/adducin family protein [Clostridiales bacterium]